MSQTQKIKLWLALLFLAALLFSAAWRVPRSAAALFLVLLGWFLFARIRSSWRFKKLGYRIVSTGRESFNYEECVESQTRSLQLYGEHMERAIFEIYLPSESQWDLKMPVWAHGRRDEIVERVRSEFGIRRVRYVDAA